MLPVTKKHKIPRLKQWILHTVEASEDQANITAKELSRVLDIEYAWYADLKNNNLQYVIFLDKVFKVNRSKKEDYETVIKYIIDSGISEFQRIKNGH